MILWGAYGCRVLVGGCRILFGFEEVLEAFEVRDEEGVCYGVRAWVGMAEEVV